MAERASCLRARGGCPDRPSLGQRLCPGRFPGHAAGPRGAGRGLPPAVRRDGGGAIAGAEAGQQPGRAAGSARWYGVGWLPSLSSLPFPSFIFPSPPLPSLRFALLPLPSPFPSLRFASPPLHSLPSLSFPSLCFPSPPLPSLPLPSLALPSLHFICFASPSLPSPPFPSLPLLSLPFPFASLPSPPFSFRNGRGGSFFLGGASGPSPSPEWREPPVCPSSLPAGTVQQIQAMPIAQVLHDLGAGRTQEGQRINPRVGAELLVSTGKRVSKGNGGSLEPKKVLGQHQGHL